MRRVLLALRLLLAAVFLYAAYTKLKDPWLLFAMTVDAYQILPHWAVLVVARALPWMELLIGLLLIAGLGLRYVSAAASILLGVFLAIMIRSYAKGMAIDCGCFGPGDVISAKTLARDGLLFGSSLALTVLALLRRVPSREPIAVGLVEAESAES